MKIVACYKCVPFAEEIEIKKDRTVDLSTASIEIGQYDLRAVETGMRLAEAVGSKVLALTAGGQAVTNSKMKKAILARGPAEMYGVHDDLLDKADTYMTAKVLASAIGKIGEVDLVICGEGSSDMYAQQVGNVTGAILGWNTVNAVCDVKMNGDSLRVERVGNDGKELLDVELPAVISVTGDINTPRIATMKDIMAAGKKPATVWALADVCEAEAKTATQSILAPQEAERKRIVLEGTSDEAIDTFMGYIKKVL